MRVSLLVAGLCSSFLLVPTAAAGSPADYCLGVDTPVADPVYVYCREYDDCNNDPANGSCVAVLCFDDDVNSCGAVYHDSCWNSSAGTPTYREACKYVRCPIEPALHPDTWRCQLPGSDGQQPMLLRQGATEAMVGI